MNREILFRAKATDSGECVECYVVRRRDDYKNADTCRQNIYVIDPDTLCQYTG